MRESRADEIISRIEAITKSGKASELLNADIWMDIAVELSILIGDETKALEFMRREIAQKTLDIIKLQDKRNITLAEMEVRALPEYEEMKNQEHKCEQIKELIRVAKKNADTNSL